MKDINLDKVTDVAKINLNQTGVSFSGERISRVFSDVIAGESFDCDREKSAQSGEAWKAQYDADFQAQLKRLERSS